MRRTSGMLVALAVVTLCVTACIGHRHVFVDAATFERQLGTVNSASHARYLGHDGKRAYATRWERGFLLADGHDVWSVALDDLPAATRDAVLAGQNPWAR